mmetsp:Transcript_11868/g.26026  ORF Transcript_11868/g.26026 Transcript_11868/m.26026 type:complete len:108 (+) Transcript_11868:784-1107(+)
MQVQYYIIDHKKRKEKQKQDFCSPNLQFKKVQTEQKLDDCRSRMNNNHAPNALQQHSGHTLTPLIEGKIQYYYLTVQILKQNENDRRYFYPRTDYNLFVIRNKAASD